MKALMWNAPEQMDVVDIERPTVSEKQVLIKVHTVGICGSDLEGYLGHNSLRTPPLLMGHEVAGIVQEVGHGVEGVSIGQRIVVNPLIACGHCPRCLRGYVNLCDYRQIIGIHHPGGYAEYMRVPEGNVVSVPDQLDIQSAALTEPLACSLRAAKRALASIPFANMVVIGAGAIGLLSAFVSQVLGAGRVVVLDKNERRLKMARELGFDAVLDSSEHHFQSKLEDIMGAKGVDVVLDAAGFQSTRELGMQLVNPGGMFLNIGLGIDDTTLPINHLIRSEIDIKGSFCYTAQDFIEALQLLADRKITAQGWTTLRPLDQGAESFQELVSGQISHGKILLQP